MGVEHERGRTAREVRERLVESRIAELVIRGVYDVARHSAYTKSKRTAWMVQPDGRDFESRHGEGAFTNHLDVRLIRKVLRAHREEGRSKQDVEPVGMRVLELGGENARPPARAVEL